MSLNNIIDAREIFGVRRLSALQLANLKHYFDTTKDSDPHLAGVVNREIKRRMEKSEMYEAIDYGD